MKSRSGMMALIFFVVGVAGCASAPKPVFYPNAHLKSVGTRLAEQDLADCQRLAEAAGADSSQGAAGQTAKNVAGSAAVGAASGAVGGAIIGSAASGSAIGAASAATAAILRSIFSSGDKPLSPAYTNFVNRCLQERGYEVTGWD